VSDERTEERKWVIVERGIRSGEWAQKRAHFKGIVSSKKKKGLGKRESHSRTRGKKKKVVLNKGAGDQNSLTAGNHVS